MSPVFWQGSCYHVGFNLYDEGRHSGFDAAETAETKKVEASELELSLTQNKLSELCGSRNLLAYQTLNAIIRENQASILEARLAAIRMSA